jgi:hypothetical protein
VYELLFTAETQVLGVPIYKPKFYLSDQLPKITSWPTGTTYLCICIKDKAWACHAPAIQPCAESHMTRTTSLIRHLLLTLHTLYRSIDTGSTKHNVRCPCIDKYKLIDGPIDRKICIELRLPRNQ